MSYLNYDGLIDTLKWSLVKSWWDICKSTILRKSFAHLAIDFGAIMEQ